MEQGARSLGKLGAQRGSSRNLGQLRRLAAYLRPLSRPRRRGADRAGAGFSAVLSLGVGLRHLIDGGFAEGHPEALNHALEAVAIVIVVLAVATFLRSYLVTWLGERVVADLRRAVYAHVLRLLARLLRGHAHRRGAVAPDHRHHASSRP